MSGVDIALWDIMGKAANLPVYKLLGGKARGKVEADASSLLFKPTGELVKEAIGLVEEGYRGIKLKIGQGIQKDAQNVREIRKAVGDDIDLMLDASSGFEAHSAIALGQELEPYNIFWFEEPVPPDDLDGYRKVAEALKIPVAAGESEFTRYGFRDLITKGKIAFIQPDVARAGGISVVKKIAVAASLYNLPYCPHTGASGATWPLHFNLRRLFPIFRFFEFMYPPNPLREDILKEPLPPVRDGFIEVLDGPGLGIELDDDKIAKYLRR